MKYNYNFKNMKTLLNLFLGIALLFTACSEKRSDIVVTKIFADGSCYREFSGTADSSFMVGITEKNNPFPVILDSTWRILWSYERPSVNRTYSNKWPLKQWVWEKDTSKHLTLNVIARKVYPSVDSMSKSFRYSTTWDSIIPKASLEKHFRWFFTFYKFQEIYPKYDKLKAFPIDSFLKKDEVLLYTSDAPKFSPEMNGKEIRELLDDIEQRKELWLNFNYFGEYYRILQHDFPFTRSVSVYKVLETLKDSLLKDDAKHEPRYFLQCMSNYFKGYNFLATDSSTLVHMLLFKENFEKPFSKSQYYNLIMPGKVIETNARLIHGDTLRWKVDAYRFYFNDYEIKAESRITNIWAFVVSVIFVAGVILSFFIKRKS